MRKRIILTFTFVIAFILMSLPSVVFAKEQRVAVVHTKLLEPYEQALSGFKELLMTSGYQDIEFSYFDMSKINSEIDLVNQIRAAQPVLILALGTEAALLMKDNIKDVPIVFSMVLNPIESRIVSSMNGRDDNITGVCLNIPIELQFKRLRDMLPNVKKVGMIFDVENKGWLKDEAMVAAKNQNLSLVARSIYSSADLRGALDGLAREADCLWAAVDNLVYNANSSKTIILKTLQSKLPFMTFSSFYVKAGALFSLECDYNDIGRQAAALAIEILNGQKPGSIPIAFPKKTLLVINQNTANVIGISIPNRLVNEASKIF